MFSLPLIYTMEVWWAGFLSGPIRLLLYILATYILLLGYNCYAGMHPDSTWLAVMIDSIEELGIGLLVSAALLFLIGRISPALHLSEVIGKVVVEAMTVAIGISVGTAQLGMQGDDQKAESSQKTSAPEESRFEGQLVIAFCGATLFAANIAPTEEVVAIATSSTVPALFAIIFLSLLLAALILYYIQFSGSKQLMQSNSIVSVLIGTLTSYAAALTAAAGFLWFFGRFEQVAFVTALSEVIVLGFVSTLGASAGRLLVQ